MSNTSRNSILTTIQQNKPEQVELPDIDFDTLMCFEDLTNQYCEILAKIGGQFKVFDSSHELERCIASETDSAPFIINALNLSEVEKAELFGKTSRELERLDRVYIRGHVGVAENGAIWINDSSLPNRVLPFIAQHLVLILHVKDIVATMHHAYEKISFEDLGFGAFIAGPSKTADIEQSLVIGAHGARSLMVYLINDRF